MSPHEKLLDRLQKLKRHAESAKEIGSEAEAQAFADMLQKLLLDNKLEMSDLEFEKMEQEQPVDRHFINYKEHGVDVKRRRVEWMERLGDVIARAHFCRILVHPGWNFITLVGRKDDVAVAEYMFVTLVRATERLADKAYADFSIECVNICEDCGRLKSDHVRDRRYKELICPHLSGGFFKPNWARCRGYRPAWINSFIDRLSARFYEERRRRTDETTALVRLRKSDKAVDDFMNQKKKNADGSESKKKLIKSVGGVRGSDAYNVHGSKHGREAAEKINLDVNALGGKKTPELGS